MQTDTQCGLAGDSVEAEHLSMFAVAAAAIDTDVSTKCSVWMDVMQTELASILRLQPTQRI